MASVTKGLIAISVLAHIYCAHDELILCELLILGHMYQGKDKGLVLGIYKYLPPFPLCQVPKLKIYAEERLPDPLIHPSAPQAWIRESDYWSPQS